MTKIEKNSEIEAVAKDIEKGRYTPGQVDEMRSMFAPNDWQYLRSKLNNKRISDLELDVKLLVKSNKDIIEGLIVRRKALDTKMEKLIENDDRIVAMIEKYFTNHLHEVTDLWRAIDTKLEILGNEYRSNT